MNVEPLLDRSNPLHLAIVITLIATGATSAWLGLRDGFLRREMRTSSGILAGSKAMLAGSLYVATGLFAIAGGIAFFLRARQ